MTDRQMIELLLAAAGNVICGDESGVKRSIALMHAIQGLRAAHFKVSAALAAPMPRPPTKEKARETTND